MRKAKIFAALGTIGIVAARSRSPASLPLTTRTSAPT